mgnify:CR=1 FL=1
MNVLVTRDQTFTGSLDTVIGSFRTFGRLGPTYEVLELAEPKTGTNVMLRIRVVESGELLDYPLNVILDDPLAP